MKSRFAVAALLAVSFLLSVPAQAQVTASMCQGPSGLPVKASCEADGRSKITLTANHSGAPAALLCDVTPVLLTAGVTERRALVVQNLGPNPVFLCIGAAVGCTTATGLRLSDGDMMALEVGPFVPVYCVTTVKQVSPADTRIAEVR